MNGPTEFYRQHAAVDAPRIDDGAFQPYWRIRTRTRIDRLLADGAISLTTWRAAMRFRYAVDRLAGADRSYTRDRAPGFGSNLPRLGAIEFVRHVQVTLGAFATALVWSCIVDDMTWAIVGARLHVDPKTARRWTIVALQALASIEQGRTQCTAA